MKRNFLLGITLISSLALVATITFAATNRNFGLSMVRGQDDPLILTLDRSLSASEISSGQATFKTSKNNSIIFKYNSTYASASSGVIDLTTGGNFYNETKLTGITRIDGVVSGAGNAILSYGNNIESLNVGSQELTASSSPFTINLLAPSDFIRIGDISGSITIENLEITYQCSNNYSYAASREAQSGDLLYLSTLEHSFSSAYTSERASLNAANEESGYSYHLSISSGASGWPTWYFRLPDTIKATDFTVEIFTKAINHTDLSMNFVDDSNINLLKGNKSITMSSSWQKATIAVNAADFSSGKSAADIVKIKFSTNFGSTAGNIRELYLDQYHITDKPMKNGNVAQNIEMCNTKASYIQGSEFSAEYGDTVGVGSARKVTFENSTGLPDVVDNNNYATVNAAFNISEKFTSTNGLNASNMTVSFDIKLSDEFFDSTHGTKHRFDLKFETFGDGGTSPWKTVTAAQSYVASGFVSHKGQWIHFELDTSTVSAYADASNSMGAMVLGFRGLTTTTQQTAWVLIDNVTLSVNS